jgi:hypothetical protein
MTLVGAALENALVFAIVFPALLLAEAIVPARTGRRPLRNRQTDVAWLVTVLLTAPVVTAVTIRTGRALVPHGPLASGFAHRPVAAAIVAFVVADLAAYIVHRAEHRVPMLWRYHAVHHNSSPVDALAGYRFHPVDVALERGLPVLAVAALRAPLGAFVPYLSVAFVVTLVAHMNVDMRCERAGSLRRHARLSPRPSRARRDALRVRCPVLRPGSRDSTKDQQADRERGGVGDERDADEFGKRASIDTPQQRGLAEPRHEDLDENNRRNGSERAFQRAPYDEERERVRNQVHDGRGHNRTARRHAENGSQQSGVDRNFDEQRQRKREQLTGRRDRRHAGEEVARSAHGAAE